MTRLCERPGCSEPGAAAYGMRPEDLVFWLAPLDRWNDSSGGVLCARHADAMVVPRAWTLDDLREPVPRLFRPPPPVRRPASESPRSTGSPAGRSPRRTSEHPAEQLEFEGPSAPTDPAEPVPWMPAFDTDDDLDGLLEVRSPLLARAFRGADRDDRGNSGKPPRGRPAP